MPCILFLLCLRFLYSVASCLPPRRNFLVLYLLVRALRQVSQSRLLCSLVFSGAFDLHLGAVLVLVLWCVLVHAFRLSWLFSSISCILVLRCPFLLPFIFLRCISCRVSVRISHLALVCVNSSLSPSFASHDVILGRCVCFLSCGAFLFVFLSKPIFSAYLYYASAWKSVYFFLPFVLSSCVCSPYGSVLLVSAFHSRILVLFPWCVCIYFAFSLFPPLFPFAFAIVFIIVPCLSDSPPNSRIYYEQGRPQCLSLKYTALFVIIGPYMSMSLHLSVLFRCPLFILCIVGIGIPFLNNDVRNNCLPTRPNSFVRPIRTNFAPPWPWF